MHASWNTRQPEIDALNADKLKLFSQPRRAPLQLCTAPNSAHQTCRTLRRRQARLGCQPADDDDGSYHRADLQIARCCRGRGAVTSSGKPGRRPVHHRVRRRRGRERLCSVRAARNRRRCARVRHQRCVRARGSASCAVLDGAGVRRCHARWPVGLRWPPLLHCMHAQPDPTSDPSSTLRVRWALALSLA